MIFTVLLFVKIKNYHRICTYLVVSILVFFCFVSFHVFPMMFIVPRTIKVQREMMAPHMNAPVIAPAAMFGCNPRLKIKTNAAW